jgi:hypothetical protein
LVAESDPSALAAAWDAALGDIQARARDSRLAEARVREAYSLDGMVSAYQALYVAVVEPSA